MLEPGVVKPHVNGHYSHTTLVPGYVHIIIYRHVQRPAPETHLYRDDSVGTIYAVRRTRRPGGVDWTGLDGVGLDGVGLDSTRKLDGLYVDTHRSNHNGARAL